MDNENAKKLAIPREEFEGVLKSLGVQWIAQSGFHKVLGPEGRRLYVANGKTTARVDLSGFVTDFGTKVPDQGVFGNVKQQMQFGETKEDTLRIFAALVEHMMALPPLEKKAKAEKKAPKAAGEEVKTESVLPDDEASKEARRARLEKIKAVAKEMGAPVHKDTLDLGDEPAPAAPEPTEAELEAATAPEAQA